MPSPAAASPGTTPLRLEVLVYSAMADERFVFINGRKYVEGQAVQDGWVVEQITGQGAVLTRGGDRVLLRP